MKNINFILLALFIILWGIGNHSCQAHPAFKVKESLAALETGDLDRAESCLQKARFEEPDSYEINYNLGIVSYRKRDYAKSIRFFSKASEVVKTSEERFSSYYNMGNAAFKAYDFALAVTAYKNALAVRKDYQAEYNLKVAEQKLKEQAEERDRKSEEKGKEGKDKDKDKDKDQNQNQPQNQNQNQDQQGGDRQQQNNNQHADENQQNSEGQQSNQNQQASSNKGNKEEQQGDTKGEDGKDEQFSSDKQKGDENKQEKAAQQNSHDNKDASKDGADENEQLADKEGEAPESDRRDVEMAEDRGKVSRPEASQKARAMKNIRLDKNEVEAYLKQMEARENEAQKYYRINNIEEKDPAYMDQDELREWLRVRNKKKERARTNQQDW